MRILTAAEMTFQVSILILVIGLVRKVFSDRLSVGFQYFLWIFVALRLLLPIGVTMNVVLPQTVRSVAETVRSVVAFWNENESLDDSAETILTEADGDSLVETATTGSDISSEAEETISENLHLIISDNFNIILLIVWVAGCAVLGLYILICNLRFFAHLRKYRREIRKLSNGLLLYGMPGCNCLAGVLAPAIYVDTETFEDKTEMDYVILHELQHYDFRDNLWQLVRTICLILQWYNPLVWWAYLASGRDCELACDDRTTREMTAEEKYIYGQALLSACCARSGQKMTMATAMGEERKFMEKRLKNLMQTKKKRAVVLSAVIVTVVALIALATVNLSTGSFGQSEVVYAESGAILFSNEDVTAALAVVSQYISEKINDTTDNRTYQIYYSNLEFPEEKQKAAYLSSYYQEGYTEGNVIMLQLDRVSILQEAYDGTEWPETVRYPGWCVWLGRVDANADWEIIGQGY